MFSKRRVSPISFEGEIKRGPIKDNYLGKAYYICLPGKTETILDSLGPFSSDMKTEMQMVKSNREALTKLKELDERTSDILKLDTSPNVRKKILEQRKTLSGDLKKLELEREALIQSSTNYLQVSMVSDSEVGALEIALKQYPKHALSLFKILAPNHQLEFDTAIVPGHSKPVDIMRLDLLNHLASIKSLSFTEVHRSSLNNSDVKRSPQDLQSIIDSAAEFRKVTFKNQIYGKKTPYGLNSINEEDALKKLNKDFVKIIKLDEEKSIGFQKHDKVTPEVSATKSNSPSPRSR
jgi:hypothetical protein